MGKKSDHDITVIIPNYNNERFLEKAIDSIADQTLKPSEIIVVDDRSTDGSREVLERLMEEYSFLRVIFLPVNGGVSNARNKGIEAAKTRYITFMDADDFYFNPRKLQLEMSLIKKHEREGKDILAYSAIVRADEEGKVELPKKSAKKYKSRYLEGDSRTRLISLIRQNYVPRDYVIKKSLITGVGAYSYPENFYEDLDLLMRLAMKGVEFYCTFDYGTAYRMTAGGLSKRKQKDHDDALKKITQHYYPQLSFSEKAACNSYRLSKYLTPVFWLKRLKWTAIGYFRKIKGQEL